MYESTATLEKSMIISFNLIIYVLSIDKEHPKNIVSYINLTIIKIGVKNTTSF